MPGNTVAYEGTPATYYELVDKFQVPVIDKITKKQKVSSDGTPVTYESPAIVYYDRDEQETFYKFSSFGGKPVRFDLWDAKEFVSSKDGKKFFTRHFSIEFHSFDQYGDLVREVLKINFNSVLGRSIISKLASVSDFRDINIAVGQFMDKESGKEVKYANVFEGKTKVKARVVTKYPDKQYDDDIIALPPKRYLTEDLKKTINVKEAGLDEQGFPIADPTWKKEVSGIYESVCESISAMVKATVEQYPDIPTVNIPEPAVEKPVTTQTTAEKTDTPTPKAKVTTEQDFDLDDDILNDDEVLA